MRRGETDSRKVKSQSLNMAGTLFLEFWRSFGDSGMCARVRCVGVSTSCCRGPLFVDADEPIYYNMRGVAIMNGGGDRRWKLMIDDWMTNRRRKSDNDGVDSVLELASNNNGCHVNDAPVRHRPRSACVSDCFCVVC